MRVSLPQLLSPLFAAILVTHAVAAEPRSDWIDPDTGHRVIRLSNEPGSSTLYFHDNAYSAEGDKLIFNTSSGIALVDIVKLGTVPPKAEVMVAGGRGSYMAWRSREIYFVRGGSRGPTGTPAATTPSEVFAYNFDTKETRKIPYASRTLINCDETFSLVTTVAEDPTGKTQPPPKKPYVPQLQRMFPGKKPEELTPDQIYAANKEEGLAKRTLDPRSEAFAFINLKTGAENTVGYQYGSLNHMQFSPTDPNVLLYCHEGTWHEVDRVWTIRTDGSAMTLRHKRTMDMEIAGHEFWGHDGRTIWFDLQTPRSEQFWIAGVDLATGRETRYPVERDAWSVHYNISRDGKLFSGDGGDPTQVAFAKDGMWMNLFRPQPDGSMRREKLVNMSQHNYVTGRGGIEPNGSITPDGKWVVFSGNFDGARHVYAVEIAKAR